MSFGIGLCAERVTNTVADAALRGRYRPTVLTTQLTENYGL